MHDERSCSALQRAELSPVERDANAERGVLTLVLCDYPEVYTSEELVRSVVFDVEDFMEGDAVASRSGASNSASREVGSRTASVSENPK